MAMTKDFSQCQNCIFHKIEQGRNICYNIDDGVYLAEKLEDCPDYTSTPIVAQWLKNYLAGIERQKKEEQERLERKKREQEEYERTHPDEAWELFYEIDNILAVEIYSFDNTKVKYKVDDDKSHWDGENGDVIYYYSTQRKCYEMYKEKLKQYIKDTKEELKRMKDKLKEVEEMLAEENSDE